MSTASTPTPAAAVEAQPRELKIYGHTMLFYWWPIWVLGYIMALITAFDSDKSRLAIVPESGYRKSADGDWIISGEAMEKRPITVRERVHPDKNLGVIFVVVLVLVILATTVHLRGLRSAIAIIFVLFLVVLLAYFGWWEKIFAALGHLSLHMNLGFYVFFSTALFAVWALVFFVYDRMGYWRVTPGQITQELVFGGGQRSFDTEGMAFEKLRDDLFRHWVLGLGSGDMIMHPLRSVQTGADNELQIQNVLFVGAKLRRIQQLISAERKMGP